MPRQVSEFGDELEEEERFLAWIFMGAPGPGASLHVSIALINKCGMINIVSMLVRS